MVTVESGAQRAKKVVSDSPGLQLKITTSTKFPWEVGVAADKYKYKYEKKSGEGTNTSRLGQGLNFTVNVNFWFCNDDVKKNLKSKNVIFVFL